MAAGKRQRPLWSLQGHPSPGSAFRRQGHRASLTGEGDLVALPSLPPGIPCPKGGCPLLSSATPEAPACACPCPSSEPNQGGITASAPEHCSKAGTELAPHVFPPTPPRAAPQPLPPSASPSVKWKTAPMGSWECPAQGMVGASDQSCRLQASCPAVPFWCI